MKALKLCLLGATGRVGKSLLHQDDAEVLLAIDNQNASRLISEINLGNNLFKDIECVIDFSSIQAIKSFMPIFAKAKIPVVSGTTGFSDIEFNTIFKSHSSAVPIFHCNNMSPLIWTIQNILDTLQSYDHSILDIHRKGKLDTPSGTAKMLKKENSSDVASFRLADIFGEHMILFADEYETLELRHRVLTRNVFSRNAVKIGKWLTTQKPGLYSMGNFITQG